MGCCRLRDGIYINNEPLVDTQSKALKWETKGVVSLRSNSFFIQKSIQAMKTRMPAAEYICYENTLTADKLCSMAPGLRHNVVTYCVQSQISSLRL